MATNVSLTIGGMTCDGCAQSVQSALQREEGVRASPRQMHGPNGRPTPML